MATLPLVPWPGGGLGLQLQTSQRRRPLIFTPLGSGFALIGRLLSRGAGMPAFPHRLAALSSPATSHSHLPWTCLPNRPPHGSVEAHLVPPPSL